MLAKGQRFVPPQSVATIVITDDICPECRRVCDLHTVVLAVEDHEGRVRRDVWEGCLECLKKKPATLKMELRVKDVIKLPTKARLQSQNKRARRREERAGEDIGGRRVTGSGSQEAKGDARNDRWMVEDKHTSGNSLKLTKAVLSKAIAQASKTGRNAVIRVGLADGTELAICRWSDFAEEVADD